MTQDQGIARGEGVRERPILFSGPMVRALLAGRKTQTRRVVKLEPPTDAHEVFFWSGEGLRRAGWSNVSEPGLWARRNGRDGYIRHVGRCPYGVPGDRLWVKETWAVKRFEPCLHHERDWQELCGPTVRYLADGAEILHRGDRATNQGIYRGPVEKGRPSIHMPRWASRLTLEITDVRVERLRDISEADAQAEGLEWVTPGMWSVHRSLPIIGEDPRQVYLELWDHINGEGASALNPWVWVVSFAVRTATLTRGSENER